MNYLFFIYISKGFLILGPLSNRVVLFFFLAVVIHLMRKLFELAGVPPFSSL
jgi:hypothetical protein